MTIPLLPPTPTGTVKINLTGRGDHLTRLDKNKFLMAGREGEECDATCPEPPYYHCTRTRGHAGDHAAHGYWYELNRKLLVMYARWSQ